MQKIPYYINISKSIREGKKYEAIFYDKDKKKIKTVHFGSLGMSDYTKHKDKERKNRFLLRFNKTIQENKNNPLSPMTLSHLILWNKPTYEESLRDYLKKFNLILL